MYLINTFSMATIFFFFFFLTSCQTEPDMSGESYPQLFTYDSTRVSPLKGYILGSNSTLTEILDTTSDLYSKAKEFKMEFLSDLDNSILFDRIELLNDSEVFASNNLPNSIDYGIELKANYVSIPEKITIKSPQNGDFDYYKIHSGSGLESRGLMTVLKKSGVQSNALLFSSISNTPHQDVKDAVSGLIVANGYASGDTIYALTFQTEFSLK